MSIQARWRLADQLTAEAEDPFEGVLTSSGLSVDLSGTEDEVFAGLRGTLETEGRLAQRGITCELKESGVDCLVCSEYAGNRPHITRAPLCRLGRDQRMIEKRYEELRREPFVDLIEIALDYMAMGDTETDGELLAAMNP